MNFFDTIKTITFDVGFTIIFPAENVGISYQRQLAKYGHKICDKTLENSFFQSWLQHVSESPGLVYGTTEQEAVITWSTLLNNMLKSFSDHNFCPEMVNSVAKTIYEDFATANAWKIHSNWEMIFKRCKDRGWKVGLISNWDVRLANLLEELKISEMVDFQIISAEHGVEKPNRGIFELAAKKANCQLNDIVHVGDTFVDDVMGAVEAGAKAIWCNHHNHKLDQRLDNYKKQVIVIDDLSELLHYLG